MIKVHRYGFISDFLTSAIFYIPFLKFYINTIIVLKLAKRTHFKILRPIFSVWGVTEDKFDVRRIYKN